MLGNKSPRDHIIGELSREDPLSLIEEVCQNSGYNNENAVKWPWGLILGSGQRAKIYLT